MYCKNFKNLTILQNLLIMLQCLKDNKETKNEKEIYPPPYILKAFTLSEVLITLVIIGIIAAITVPNIIQSSQNKELPNLMSF